MVLSDQQSTPQRFVMYIQINTFEMSKTENVVMFYMLITFGSLPKVKKNWTVGSLH